MLYTKAFGGPTVGEIVPVGGQRVGEADSANASASALEVNHSLSTALSFDVRTWFSGQVARTGVRDLRWRYHSVEENFVLIGFPFLFLFLMSLIT